MAKKASKKVTDNGIEISFESGQTLTISLDQLNQDIITKLAIHGLSQKVGDSYAGADINEAFDLANSVVERLVEGEWTQAREGGGGTTRVSMLVEALAAATDKTNDEALEVVKAMSDDQKKELRKHPAIDAQLTRISAERAMEKAKKAAEALQSADIEPLTL